MPKNSKLNILKSSNSVALYTVNMPLDVYSQTFRLSPGVNQTATVPNNVNTMLLSYSAGSAVQVSLEDLALPIAGGAVVQGSVKTNPPQITVATGEVYNFKSPNDDVISVNFYMNTQRS